MMHNSPFTVAGMSASTTSHHSPNLNSWGGSSTSGPSFGDSLSQSRSHYQSGYLMSNSQSNNMPQGSPRVDEVPTVQTKAKMNQMLSRGSAPDFGMDSMFQSSRQRQTLADEDAPPMSSINDIPNEFNVDHSPKPFNGRRGGPVSPNTGTQQDPTYIVVFGYPQDKYSVTVEYFKSLGHATEADPHLEIANCFRIGYQDAGDAMRAVRKNGEILGGSFMIGAKWADPAQAEVLLGQQFGRSTFGSSPGQNFGSTGNFGNDSMQLDEPAPPNTYQPETPTVGTPIRLAPSTSAFRQATAGGLSASKPATPQNHGNRGAWLGPSASAPALSTVSHTGPPPPPSSQKGYVGQAVDLIFGW
ncbi:hypothetical protein CPB83DRAFT_790851 [Crepidotus variabilis]|uniref:RRM Nup35-type domain-containing protein n=1 Tax=Crepidotus variabilis TaxID=179855 RepID=A0A9P6EHG2_9AGAR|nr:hypothetical protein CPB83DRAFT_790851 [Crepidotus variabilis]